MEQLKVYMLGGFRMSYDGREIALGRNTTAKFVQLLQLIWLSGSEGVTKDRLMHTLYEGEERANMNNSMNNLIYQMRRQMVRAGLPEMDYIIKKQGAYYPDPKVSMTLDVDEFKKLVASAGEAGSESERFVLYSQAFELFQGTLLPELSTEIWVITRNVAIQDLFDESAEWLGGYLKEKGDYQQMLQIYQRASDYFPDRDWQVGQIEALIYQGNFKEAYRLYDKTVRYYEEELGITASQKLLDCYQVIREKLNSEPGRISEIQDDLLQTRRVVEAGQDAGAYDCSHPSFIDAYHILSRNMERSGDSVFMMRCTLVDYEGKLIRNEEKRNGRSEALASAIHLSLRQGDVFCKYNASQYLVLLTGTSREDCDTVYRRIENKLKDLAGNRAEMKYSVVSLAELKQPA